jgi:type I restriction enzyme S subunit
MTVKRTRAASTKKELALQGADGTGDLPPNWLWTTLGEVAESMKNGIYKPASSYADDGLACLRMYNIDEGRIVWRDIKRMRLSESEIREYELLPGDILVNRVNSRELVGKTAAISAGLERCVFESKNIRVRLRRDVVSPEFISYRLLSAGSRYFTQNAQQVVGMASISQPQVARFPLPLPPLPEQRRIVAEIEKQFTRLEAGVAALRRVQANLKRYCAAVLKAACEGHLVPTEAALAKTGKPKSTFESGETLLARILTERRKTWQGRGKCIEPASLTITDLPSLPDGWTWAKAEQLCEFITKGTTPSADKMHAGAGDIPFIKVYNLTFNGTLNLDYKPTFIDRKTHRFELARSGVRSGDVLINIVGPPLGQVSIVPTTVEEANINQAVARFRVVLPDCQRYVAICLMTKTVIGWAVRRAKTTAGQTNLTLELCRDLPIPLPPLAEQLRIVAEVERRLSVVDELEAVVTSNLQRACRLRQSILSSAFSGRLIDASASPT